MNRAEVSEGPRKRRALPFLAGTSSLLIVLAIAAIIFPACAAAAELSQKQIQSRLESALWVKAIRLISAAPFRKWNAALDRHRTENRYDGSLAGEIWRHTVKGLRLLPEDERPAAANTLFNSIPYGDDRQLWNRSDYWATPFEMLSRNAGDCEDYALAKYFALRDAGTDARKLLVLVVRNAVNGSPHAVLLVARQSGIVVLDNLRRDPLPLASYAETIKPVYAVNEHGAWFLTGDSNRDSIAGQPTASGAAD